MGTSLSGVQPSARPTVVSIPLRACKWQPNLLPTSVPTWLWLHRGQVVGDYILCVYVGLKKMLHFQIMLTRSLRLIPNWTRQPWEKELGIIVT